MGNSETQWNSIIEVDVQQLPLSGSEVTSDGNAAGVCPAVMTGGSDTVSESPTVEDINNSVNPGNTDATKTPAQNFNLTYWKITYPDASETYPPQVRANEFYTDANTGAMVFECVNRGEQTSSSTKYARSELREMLRGPDKSLSLIHI